MTARHTKQSELRERAQAVIPGGMYGHQSVARVPQGYPQFLDGGEGARVRDADGNIYLDYMCAYGPNLFGYGHREINEAFIRQMAIGDTLLAPTARMVELAEAFVAMVAHADWAMFCKNGTDATSMAMVTARAHTGRQKLIMAKGAYHGAAPWCTPGPAGTIPSDRVHQIYCEYNNLESLEAAAAAAGDDLAAIFAAPFKHDAFVEQQAPDLAYARRAREICDRTGAVLIVDDVRAGFRIARDCSWSAIGVQPDLSTWGKCIANGHPISALLGSNALRAAAASIFVTGSYWFQAAPMAAALTTLKLIRETDYLERTIALGERLRAGLAERAQASGFDFRQSGPVQMPLFLFEGDAELRLGFAWCKLMLDEGIYMHPWHNMFLCAAMTEADIDLTLDAAEKAFGKLRTLAPKSATRATTPMPVA
jgi:glutamate-1-semialdehyde 2,1-aminomutase